MMDKNKSVFVHHLLYIVHLLKKIIGYIKITKAGNLLFNNGFREKGAVSEIVINKRFSRKRKNIF